jgi:diguanylate cyclase (GGDEF)-like protein/PAS domain S-box-containing protein
MTFRRPSVRLSENDARLRAEIERRTAVTPAMLHSIDETGRLISVSDAWLAKLGYSREEVLGRPSTDFLTSESRERAIREVLPEFFRRGRCENVEYQMVCKDGRVIDVLLSAVLENEPMRGGRASLAVIMDVTALKVAERRLAEGEARYRGLVEDQSELVSLATPEGELRYVNRAYASLYGTTPEEMVGRSLFEFIPAEQHDAVAQHLKSVCQAKQSIEGENQVLLHDERKRWVAWTNRALTDAEGRVTAIHSVGRDIEERVAAEQRLQESEARYRFLAEHSTDMILLVGLDGQRYYASPACRALLGYEPEEMLEIRTRDALHPDDVTRVIDALATGGAGGPLTYRMRRKDGSYLWVETTGRVVRLAEQTALRLVIVRNIEQRIVAEQRLRESETRYRLLADNSTDMVFQLDDNMVHRYVSPACRDILGYEPKELIGVNPVSMAHPEDAMRLPLVLQVLLSGRVERQSIVNRIRHREGHWIWAEVQLKTLRDPQTGRSSGLIGTLRDISVRKAVEDELADANRRLRALAGEDGLTGLCNRRAFDEAFAREIRRARREKKSLGLIMIDVDRFKAFNDQYGHPAGDECLRRISGAITTTIRRPGDIAARYGGEEFAVLLPDTDETGTAVIAERIRKTVVDFSIEHCFGRDRIATISAGVAAMAANQSVGGSETLLEAADRALYRAKDLGRNIVVRASGDAHSSRVNSPTAA